MSEEHPHATCGNDEVQAWIEANRDQLPHRFDDVVSHSMPYRLAICAELPPRERGQLWLEHLARYRTSHTDLTGPQLRVLDHAEDVVGRESTFAHTRTTSDPELDQLKDAAIAAFGRDEARNLIATLGPPETARG